MMLWFGTTLCLVAGVFLVGAAIVGRPTRGEAFVGAHLVTGPLAIVDCIGWGCVLWARPLPVTAANVAMIAAWPGSLIAITFLPLAAYGGRSAGVAKVACCAVAAAPLALGLGTQLHPALVWTGAAVLASCGFGGAWLVVGVWTRPMRARVVWWLRGGRSTPSSWEVQQAEWQRGQWRSVPPDADVASLLPHARSLAADVKTQCLERLASRKDLDEAIGGELLGPEPTDALWYVTHHFPRSRQSLVGPVHQLLSSTRARWEARQADSTRRAEPSGNPVAILDCAIAVLLDGGDLGDELRAWCSILSRMPGCERMAKVTERWLRKAKRAPRGRNVREPGRA